MQDTEPTKALSTELNRLSEIAARDSKESADRVWQKGISGEEERRYPVGHV